MVSVPQGQPSLVQYCEGSGIRVMGYSPLGGSSDRAPDAHGTTLLTHPTVNAIAEAAGKSAGQVLIRWAVQQGVISCVPPPPPPLCDRLCPRGVKPTGW